MTRRLKKEMSLYEGVVVRKSSSPGHVVFAAARIVKPEKSNLSRRHDGTPRRHRILCIARFSEGHIIGVPIGVLRTRVS